MQSSCSSRHEGRHVQVSAKEHVLETVNSSMAKRGLVLCKDAEKAIDDMMVESSPQRGTATRQHLAAFSSPRRILQDMRQATTCSAEIPMQAKTDDILPCIDTLGSTLESGSSATKANAPSMAEAPHPAGRSCRSLGSAPRDSAAAKGADVKMR